MEKKSRKERMKEILSELANMSEDQKKEFAARVPIINPEGKALSPRNQMLLMLQIPNPTVVGGYKQWRENGRQVMKGETGSLIFFPVGPKDKETGNIEEAERFYTATVFDISQTQEIKELEEVES